MTGSARTISSLSLAELERRLHSPSGLVLSGSAFSFRVRSRIQQVASAIHLLYADYAAEPDDAFADFPVAILSRWHGLKRVCVLDVDGQSPFTPLAYGEAFALLEWGMNWCVTTTCHTYLTIHSAVLAKGEHAVILPAPPGSGKSTLCAALMLRGWRLLSDEMALLDPDTGELWPAPRPVGLKNRSIDVISQRATDAVWGPIAHDTVKGTVRHLKPSAVSVSLARQTARPAWLVFPRYSAGAGIVVSALEKSRSLVDLASNSFNQQVHGRNGFRALVKLVDESASFSLEYDDLDRALDWFDALEVGA